MTRLITLRFDTEVKMEDPIRYSSKKIRQIRKNCHDLILEMEKRIDGIRLIAGEDPSELRQAIECYRIQLDHLDTAAELYDQCSAKAEAEVIEALKRGGA